MDRIRIEPDGLQTEDQLTSFSESFWHYGTFIRVLEGVRTLSVPTYL